MLEGEEEQEIENLFEKIVKEFGEGNRHTSPQEAQSPKQVGPKGNHTKTHHH